MEIDKKDYDPSFQERRAELRAQEDLAVEEAERLHQALER